MKRSIIAAVAADGTIGDDGRIPWDGTYPEDLQHFRDTTMGHPVIMGRETYESLDGPLAGRMNIVLTTQDITYRPRSVFTVNGFDDAFELAEATGADTAYIAGGASIYEQVLEADLADEMVLTAIPGKPDGDAYFPGWDLQNWERQDRSPADSDDPDSVNVYTYRRLQGDS